MAGSDAQRERLELAATVADHIQILDVILSETKAVRTPGKRSDLRDAGIETDVSTVFSANEELNTLSVLARFHLHASRADDPKQRLLSIEAEFVLIYRVSSMEGLTQKHFEAFANANGVFNAWPYWREYVHSMTQRMGLDALVVPVFRVTGRKPTTAKVAANTQAKEIDRPCSPQEKPQGKAGKRRGPRKS